MTRQNQKQLPKGWKWVRLGDVAEITRGASPRPIKDFLSDKGIPWIKIADATKTDSRYIYRTKEFIKPEGEQYSKSVHPGDLIVSNSATPGLPRIVMLDGCIHDGWLLLRNIHVDKWYLFYTLLYLRRFLVSQGSGTIFTNLKTEILKNLQIPLPPLPEQKAIAEVLSSLDDKIELLQEQNKTLEEMAQTLFRKWFIDNSERKRWKKVRLGDGTLATIIKSGIESFTGYKTYLATRDVQGLEIVGGTPIMYNSRPSRANMQPSVYSVWFAKKWGVQKLLMFDEFSNNVDDYVLSTGFLGLKTKPETHYYIWLFVITDEFQEIKDTLVSGSVQPDITNAGVMKILIEAPPIKLLESFNHKVKGMFAKISANKRQIEVLRDLRDLLLPKLIIGEVRVKV